MDAAVAAMNDDDEDDEKEEEEEEDKEQFRELERMQSMTHEDIVEKIMQLRTREEAEDDDEESDDDDESKNDDLTGFEGTKIAMVIAQGMRAHVARARLEEEIASRPKDWKPPPAHETFLRKLRRKIYRDWKQDAPSLQRDVDEQEARRKIEEKREEKRKVEEERSRAIHTRGALLKPLPNNGKSIQRKKEGTKLKKNDPEAQGGVYERRKMQEEGAGLFVAPMMPEKVNREIGKLTRKSAGKGWFDLPAAEYTPELKRDMRTLKLRGAYDPKRFYKNADTSKLPTHFSIGTVVEGAHDFHSGRMTKKERGRTFAEEIAKDAAIKKARTNRFTKVQNEKKGSGGDKRKSNKGKGKK